MPQVQTVLGPVDAGELGKTLIHEHFRGRDESTVFQWPHLHDEEAEYAEAVEMAQAVVANGVQTVVEPTAMMLGRDVPFLRRLASEVGLHIVACTGIYTYDHLPINLESRDADFMADLFVHDIEQGIQGTEARAAFIKCAADEPGVNDNIEKVHRAVARASVRTGVPIMAHSRPASNTGPRQVEIFLEEGVDPAKIQIAHCGDTDDVDYITGLLDQGVYVGLDRYGIEMYLPADRRNATVLALLERGHVERMFLSQDYVVALDWFPEEQVQQLMEAGAVKDWSMTLLFDTIIPQLREGGMTDEQLDTMLVDNPRRWLAGE
jgi:phosphotriesterase-related protein